MSSTIDTATAQKPPKSEPTQTPRSGVPEIVSKRQPRKMKRPWLSLPVHKQTGKIMVGKDGVTPSDMPWCFDCNTGTFRFATVNMASNKKRDYFNPNHGLPRANGPVYERSFGYPIIDFEAVQKIYDESEKSGESLRSTLMRSKHLRGEEVTRKMLRLVAGAPDVTVDPDRTLVAATENTAALDREIDRLMGV